jgi:rRNA maturation RNase YbeY
MALLMTVDDDVVIARALKSRLRREINRMVKAAARTDHHHEEYNVLLRLSSDASISSLGCECDGRNQACDVLAFPEHNEAMRESGHLGHIVISVQRANRQGKQGLHTEILRLASLGLCSLLGYDKHSEDGERLMNARAAALRLEAMRQGHVRAA